MSYSTCFKPALLLGTVLSAQGALAAQTADQEFLIVASRIDTARFETGSTVSVLDADYLQQNQIRTVADALRDVPGVSVNRLGGPGGQTQVRIRGAEANHTLILVDGIEVSATSGTDFDLAHLLALNVDRIEVLRGAQTALWGPDALGGVINIITARGQGEPSYELQLEAGRYDSHQETASITGGNESGHYSLSATQQKTHGISSAPEELGNPERDGYRNQSLNLKAGLNLSELSELEFVLRHTRADVEYDFNPFDADATADVSQTFARLGGRWQSPDQHWLHRLDLSLADNDRDDFSVGVPSSLFRGNKKKAAYQSTYSWSAEALQQQLTLALEYEEETFANEYIDPFFGYRVDTTHYSSGAALEYGLNVDQDWFLTLDLRRDRSSLFDSEISWRAALATWLGEQVRLHSSAGEGIKFPSMTELYGYSSTYVGNADLQPEQARTVDLGLEYHLLEWNGLVDLTLFHSRVEDLIVGAGITSFNNPDRATLKGVELSSQLQPASNLRLNASYTYTATDDGQSNDLIRRPRHAASLNGNYLLANGKTRLNLGLNYQGKRYDNQFDLTDFSFKRVELKAYSLVSLALSHQYSPQLEVYGRLENALDREYEEAVDYATEGRMLTLGVNWKGLF